MSGSIFSLAGGKKYVWLAVGILVLWGGYKWYTSGTTNTVQTQYKTAAAEKGTLVKAVTTTGNVVVDQSASVDPSITGTVRNLAVAVGDQVKKGQLLFTIENDDLSVSVAKATATLQQSANSVQSAKVAVDQARADYDAAKHNGTSSKQKDVLKDKISIAKNGVVSAEKSYAATRADYTNQLSNAGERRVTAPIDGTVNEINVKNGDDLASRSSASTHSAPIVIGDLGTLKVEVEVNEVDVPSVSIGQKATITFDAISDLTLTGKVEKMDSLGTVTQGVVTYNVTVGLDSIDARVKPGMSATAEIVTEVKQDVLMVSNSAVKTKNGETYVEALVNGAPSQKNVTAGIANDSETEIVSGLSVGEEVVTQTITASSTTKTTSSNSGVRIPGLGGGR